MQTTCHLDTGQGGWIHENTSTLYSWDCYKADDVDKKAKPLEHVVSSDFFLSVIGRCLNICGQKNHLFGLTTCATADYFSLMSASAFFCSPAPLPSVNWRPSIPLSNTQPGMWHIADRLLQTMKPAQGVQNGHLHNNGSSHAGQSEKNDKKKWEGCMRARKYHIKNNTRGVKNIIIVT